MNAYLLLKHFDRISDAPDAVARLRRFILDLAVRGKLVEQDPDDEPAAELLKRIQAEKARLVKEGSSRKEKSRAPLAADELPFPIPKGWQWSQLAEIGFISPRNDVDGAIPTSFVPMTLIPADYGIPHKHEIRPWSEIKTGYTHFAEGDVGLAKITPCFENGKSTVFRSLTGGIGAGTTELHIVRPLLVDADYVLLFLKCPYFIESGIPRMTGTAGQKRVSADYFAHSPFPLPPLAEQHSIIAKADELMALCDQLEAAKNEREARRDRLVAASLHRIGTAPAAADEAATAAQSAIHLRDAARFHLHHLPRLTTRLEHIKQMRRAILNLAVRGRLVPQNPNDEPAAELLKRIQADKARLVKEGKIKKPAPLPSVEIGDEPFPIPSDWMWCRLGEIGDWGSGSTPPRGNSEYYGGEIVWLKSGELGDSLALSDSEERVSKLALEKCSFRLNQPGDVLIAMYGATIGKLAVLAEPAVTNQAVCGCTPFSGVFNKYLFLFLLSRREDFHGQSEGGAQPNISKVKIVSSPFSFPPLAEQHRIVAKVDELMALCDQLESQLTATQTDNRRLLEAVLHEALAPALEKAA